MFIVTVIVLLNMIYVISFFEAAYLQCGLDLINNQLLIEY